MITVGIGIGLGGGHGFGLGLRLGLGLRFRLRFRFRLGLGLRLRDLGRSLDRLVDCALGFGVVFVDDPGRRGYLLIFVLAGSAPKPFGLLGEFG